ncbi:MAG: hypothetical protein U9R08_01340 [Nanoarchaeota archaeon]|nr:hypothetical protein [Nanoarchaeota archaeon]
MFDFYVKKFKEKKKEIMSIKEFTKYVSDGVDSLERHYARKEAEKSIPEPVKEQQHSTTTIY